MKDKKMFRRILRYMKPYWLNYTLALVLTGIVVLCDILNPVVIGQSLKEIGADQINFNKVILLFVAGIVLAVVQSVIQYFQTMLLQHTGQNIVYKMRKEVFCHIQSLSHNQFNNIPVGTLVTRVSGDGFFQSTLSTSHCIVCIPRLSAASIVLLSYEPDGAR